MSASGVLLVLGPVYNSGQRQTFIGSEFTLEAIIRQLRPIFIADAFHDEKLNNIK